MISHRQRLTTAIILMLALATAAFGQQQTQPAPTTQATTPRSPDYVDFTGFKGKVFDVKHRDPRALVEALRPLGSGFKGATMQYSSEFRTLTVRDFPENIAAMEEALKRLDIPQPARSDVELRMNILIASNDAGMPNQVPSDMSDVVKQLQATFNYKNYANIATVIQRAADGAGVRLAGTAELTGWLMNRDEPWRASYSYHVPIVNLSGEPSGSFSVNLRDTSFEWTAPGPVGNAVIRTSINMRSGEKVVVGTATLGNKGLILVLSARVLK